MADCSVCLLALSLFHFICCGALTVPICSSVSCDHTGSAMLNTSECYSSNKSCDWSLRDTNGTTLAVVTPSANVSVSCNRSEVHLKVLCDSPKYEIVYCYKFNRTKTEGGAQRIYGACQSRACVFAYVAPPVCVIFGVLIALTVWWTRRQQDPVAAQNNGESSSEA